LRFGAFGTREGVRVPDSFLEEPDFASIRLRALRHS
jgi:hypothetical protein